MTMDGRRPVVFSAPRESAGLPGERAMLVLLRSCAALAALLALTALVGWVFDDPALNRVLPGWAAMQVNTAVPIVLVAAALVAPRRLSLVVAALAAVLPLLQTIEYAMARSLGVDQLLSSASSGGPHPGRSSLATAASLALLAVACALTRLGWRRIAQLLSLFVLLIGGLALLGYAYNVHSLYSLGPFDTIALPTTTAVLLLVIGLLAGQHDGALQWAMFARNAGAAVVRRQLPVALVGLPLAGYLCLSLDRAGMVNGTVTLALLVVICAVLVGGATWIAATQLARLDRRREQGLADLTDLKTNLQQQVVERAAQVQLRRDEIAVLEDRQRIAADLHDIVIQRLFAAGMGLQGATSPGLDGDTARRISNAVESMDAAIRDLRNSIFELGSGRFDTVDLVTDLEAVCTEASRVLGFTPELVVDDPDLEAESVREDLLAVLRESLANVARHASASSVQVALRTGHGLIGLTVVDNGRGITKAPHSSGTRNMADRARRRGGDCEWTPLEPHGTRVWWYVPGVPAVTVPTGSARKVEIVAGVEIDPVAMSEEIDAVAGGVDIDVVAASAAADAALAATAGLAATDAALAATDAGLAATDAALDSVIGSVATAEPPDLADS